MTLVKWKPVNSLFNLDNEFDTFFDNFFRSSALAPVNEDYFVPVTDVDEDENSYRLTMELPGLNKDDVKIELKDDVLTIQGEKKAEKKEKDGGYRFYERRFGKFERSFRLQNDVVADKIDAKFKDGILTVEIPKAEKAKPKQISIK